MNSPLDALPPDDTGTDTLRRYIYQAQIAFPFCLRCAIRDKIRSVIMEHFEDIVIEYDDYWHFIQVKTRNASRGAWKIVDAMDGLRSLYRTYKETSHLQIKCSLFLEGAVVKDDILEELLPNRKNLPSDKICSRVQNDLKIRDIDEVKSFLKIVTVNPNQPARGSISLYNMQCLSEVAANLSIDEVRSVEERVSNEILRAMALERLDSFLYKFICKADGIDEDIKIKVEGKRLTSASLQELFGSSLHGKYSLLKRVTQLDQPTPTNLEKKLLAGGAPNEIIKNAKMLRSNASIRETEYLASDIFLNEDYLEDVHLRIETLSNSISARHKGSNEPAITIWYELLESIDRKTSTLDPNRVYKQDPYLLLGAACTISDLCNINWGGKIA